VKVVEITFFFVFSGAMERNFFRAAINMIENGTCIRFIHKNDNHNDYLLLDHDK